MKLHNCTDCEHPHECSLKLAKGVIDPTCKRGGIPAVVEATTAAMVAGVEDNHMFDILTAVIDCCNADAGQLALFCTALRKGAPQENIVLLDLMLTALSSVVVEAITRNAVEHVNAVGRAMAKEGCTPARVEMMKIPRPQKKQDPSWADKATGIPN